MHLVETNLCCNKLRIPLSEQFKNRIINCRNRYPKTHIHIHALSWIGKGIYLQSGGLKYFQSSIIFSQKLMLSCKLFKLLLGYERPRKKGLGPTYRSKAYNTLCLSQGKTQISVGFCCCHFSLFSLQLDNGMVHNVFAGYNVYYYSLCFFYFNFSTFFHSMEILLAI